MITAEEAKNRREASNIVISYLEHLHKKISVLSLQTSMLQSLIPQNMSDEEIHEVEHVLKRHGFSVDVVLSRHGKDFLKEMVVSW